MKNNNMAYLELMTKESYENKQFLDFYQNMIHNMIQNIYFQIVNSWLSIIYIIYYDYLDKNNDIC